MRARDFRSAFVVDGLLERAIEAWRADDAPVERLSAQARAQVLARCGETVGTEPKIAGLFFPAWRWAWAGVVPVVALTIALGVLGVPRGQGPGTGVTRVEALKLPGEVVFLIANGGTEHRVSRRSIPDRSATGTAVPTTNGSFRDALDSGETIVFYRID